MPVNCRLVIVSKKKVLLTELCDASLCIATRLEISLENVHGKFYANTL